MRTTVVALLLVALLGCSTAESTLPAPASVSAGPTVDRRSPEEVAQDPGARLVTARIVRTASGLRVAAWWEYDEKGSRRERAIAVREPGTVPTYESWSRRRWSELAPITPQPTAVPGSLEGLMVNEIVSLQPQVSALVGGGDGATLFPFQKVARSSDDGATWTTYDVPEIGGERAFTSGEVVLPDRRLLVLLGSWSGDRRNHPGQQHHGLWMSTGHDWSTYRPVQPVFKPTLRPPPGGWLAAWSSLDSLWASSTDGGVIWAQTWDNRLYASIDGARSFAEVPAR